MALRPICTSLLCGVVLGCAAEEPLSIERTLDASGGTVTLGDDVTLVVPAGALSSPTILGLSEVRAAAVAPLPRSGVARSRRIALTPHGQTFATPVEIVLRFRDDATGVTVERLDDEADTSWEAAPGVTITGDLARLSTDRFSVIVVSGPLLDQCGDADEPCCSEGATIDDPDQDGCAGDQSACVEDGCLACIARLSTPSGDCSDMPPGSGECSDGQRTVCKNNPPREPPETLGYGYTVVCCD